ncbi:MAG TPA: aldo/keto reductase, partial [Actinobacteria bacterium]|nr:aldo/keto reductase [Actinomycetota bacterium]
FGKTGLETSIIGFGGFHLLEIHLKDVHYLLDKYLDMGGNYIETAENYGEGHSEEKIGRSVSKRRDEYILVTKTASRDKSSYLKSLEGSLRRLKTDYVDLHIIHAIGGKYPDGGNRFDDLKQILAPGGALEGAEEARKKGKIRFLGISMHGQPDVLIKSIESYPFDAVMPTINYFDRFNFPKIEEVLIPLALKKQIAIILMKPIADGYLWKSAKTAFRYAIDQPVSVVVTGINNRRMLEEDIGYANNFEPLSEEEKNNIYTDASELGNYVCRQCMKCFPCPEGINIPELFKIEGYYDRQMDDGIVDNSAEYALKERLKFWYGGQKISRELYDSADIKADRCNECGDCIPKCPYDIDIIRKLKNIDFKLGNRNIF